VGLLAAAEGHQLFVRPREKSVPLILAVLNNTEFCEGVFGTQPYVVQALASHVFELLDVLGGTIDCDELAVVLGERAVALAQLLDDALGGVGQDADELGDNGGLDHAVHLAKRLHHDVGLLRLVLERYRQKESCEE